MQGVSHRSIETKIGMFLHKQLGALLEDRRLTVGTTRLRCYQFMPLKDCRRHFAKELGQPVDWGPPGWENEQWQHSDGSWQTFMDAVDANGGLKKGSVF